MYAVECACHAVKHTGFVLMFVYEPFDFRIGKLDCLKVGLQ